MRFEFIEVVVCGVVVWEAAGKDVFLIGRLHDGVQTNQLAVDVEHHEAVAHVRKTEASTKNSSTSILLTTSVVGKNSGR